MSQNQLPKQKENITWVIWLHAAVILLIWASPFLFSWRIIIICIVAYYLQIIFFGDCVLTRRQFDIKKRSVTFYYFILIKLGFKPDMYRVRFIADHIMPWVILGTSLLWQLFFHQKPLIY